MPKTQPAHPVVLNRKKGDDAHAGRKSDHNPWVDGNFGVVTAIDITHDPERGCDAHKIAASIQAGQDKRIKYIIWNRRIMNSKGVNGASPWSWRPYGGANLHTKHVHISVQPGKSLYDLDSAWSITA